MAEVAIIVPTLRRPESLERAVRSLFAQLRVADRVAAVDGRLLLSSPPGGPTLVRVELPCRP